MPASLSSPADVVNNALTRIGYKLRVGSLYDGSEAASNALDIYAQTRDEILRQNDWGFAERNVSLTLLKSAPVGGYIPPNMWSTVYPALPWLYEYEYPSDCLKVRALKPSPIFPQNYDPQPYVFNLANDNAYATPKKVVLCNIADAILVYTGQVTDPVTWEADFGETVCAAIGRRIAPSLGLSAMLKIAVPDEAASMAVAEKEQG